MLTTYILNIEKYISSQANKIQGFKRKTDTICGSELPAFLLASTTKQTAQCQSVADRLLKGVFRLVDEKIYFDVGKFNIC